MARSFSTATLTVKIQEGIILGGQDMGSTHALSITGIKNVVKRLMTATTDLANILTFHATAEGPGQFIEGNVRYIRITNLDDTNHICLIFVNEHSDEFAVKVDKGQSFIFNADMSGGVVDVFDDNELDNKVKDLEKRIGLVERIAHPSKEFKCNYKKEEENG